jgi:hypothetical protein
VSLLIVVYDGTGTQKKKENVYMNEEVLRIRVEKRRKEWKRADDGCVPDHTWVWLEADGHIEDALGMAFDQQAVDHIVRKIDQLNAPVPFDGSRHSTRNEVDRGHGVDEIHEESAPGVGEYTTARAKALSEILAAIADERPDVTEFRETRLGGRLLAPKEARTLLDAPEDTLSELHTLELRKLGSILASDYVGWSEEEAIWYVLTLETPRLRPIRTRGRGKFPNQHRPFQYEVTLTVLPWVPAKEVERAYRNLQKQLLEESSRETGVRILDVVQFCWAQFRKTRSTAPWRVYFERWNQTHPDNKFANWRNFREYFLRGTTAATPTYKFPEIKPATEKQEEIRAAKERFIKKLESYRTISDRFVEIAFREPQD